MASNQGSGPTPLRRPRTSATPPPRPAQLDLMAGLHAKLKGQAQVRAHGQGFLDAIQEVAREFSRTKGSVSADDLRLVAAQRGWIPHDPNVWGAVFTGDGWVKVGRKLSAWPSNNAREIKVWQWRG